MSPQKLLKVLLLTALPASGKSELRKYMDTLTADQARNDLGMGPTVQIDDFPYVHMMRRIDEELNALGLEGAFFWDPERQFRNPIDWGTLIHLLNEDFRDLRSGTVLSGLGKENAGMHFLCRLEVARLAARGTSFLKAFDRATVAYVAQHMEKEARAMFDAKMDLCRTNLDGKTIVIEFARGGADGASMPLSAPLGYQYAFSQLSSAILNIASVLYVWTTPAESRRKNLERTDRSDPGSILHHGVPEEVMVGDYGCDDIDHLIRASGQSNMVRVIARGKVYLLPIGRFDNRVDKTTFLRGDQSSWRKKQVKTLHTELTRVMKGLGQE